MCIWQRTWKFLFLKSCSLHVFCCLATWGHFYPFFLNPAKSHCVSTVCLNTWIHTLSACLMFQHVWNVSWKNWGNFGTLLILRQYFKTFFEWFCLILSALKVNKIFPSTEITSNSVEWCFASFQHKQRRRPAVIVTNVSV